MYNLAPKGAPWFEHLTDSVRGLGEAAREWQLAHQGATLAHAHVDTTRTVFHEGKVTGQPESTDRGWLSKPFTRTPHSTAMFELQRHYLNAVHFTKNGYEHAAMLYASGAAWAVRTVRAGEMPARVVLAAADTDKRELVPGSFNADLDALKEARLSTVPKLIAAHKRLDDCLYARGVAEDIASQDYIADHEAGEMHDCYTAAEGSADAAYAYGLLVEQALSFVLLGPRAAHRKQLAAQEQAAADPEDALDGHGDGAVLGVDEPSGDEVAR
ncbi:hypothetical protein O3S80_50460 [Streptomyces sp. Lzd4kr]|nr:hypothetical protein [Streptomyces sp. Lzd4kr]